MQSVTYEDDLDLLVVAFIQPCPDDEGYMGQVSLHDNQSGALLKTVSLTEYWDVVSSVHFVYDLKTEKAVSHQVDSGVWLVHVKAI